MSGILFNTQISIEVYVTVRYPIYQCSQFSQLDFLFPLLQLGEASLPTCYNGFAPFSEFQPKRICCWIMSNFLIRFYHFSPSEVFISIIYFLKNVKSHSRFIQWCIIVWTVTDYPLGESHWVRLFNSNLQWCYRSCNICICVSKFFITTDEKQCLMWCNWITVVFSPDFQVSVMSC